MWQQIGYSLFLSVSHRKDIFSNAEYIQEGLQIEQASVLYNICELGSVVTGDWYIFHILSSDPQLLSTLSWPVVARETWSRYVWSD